MPKYRLHYFSESGNAYKLALMLALCGETFEGVWTDFSNGVTRSVEWRAAVNAMGEIPVLEEDGVKFTQTAPILLRLAERYGAFQGRDVAERFEVSRWLFWDNHKLSANMATYRWMRTFTRDPDPTVLLFLRKRADDALAVAERHFETMAFAAGPVATVADLSMQGYLIWPTNETGYDWARSHPAIAAWLGRLAALPGWQSPQILLPGRPSPRFV